MCVCVCVCIMKSLWRTFETNTTLQINYSLLDQLVKNLPAVQGTWARSLGPEYPLE